jgi:hypothetical protein
VGRHGRDGDANGATFEIVAQGSTPIDPVRAAETVRPFAAAGATWWVDADWDAPGETALRARIEAGPPVLGDDAA